MDTTAREYLRVSKDRKGRLKSPEEQHEEHVEVAAGEGWQLGTPYTEANGISASRYSRKARPGFDALMADLRAGAFGAQVLLLWEASRGSRRVGEWATLLDLLQDCRVKVYVTADEALYDPANPRDRKTLLESAVDAEFEASKISKRVKRSAGSGARAGQPHGKAGYGFRRRYGLDGEGKRILLAQEAEPAEQAVLQELLSRLDRGHSLKSIAEDFGERGIRTRSGKVFRPQHLRDLAITPAIAGLRMHNPTGNHRGPLDGAVSATWPPIVNVEQFYRVRAMLTRSDRTTWRPGSGVHFLSLIAECGAQVTGGTCASPLTVTYRRHRVREYECRKSGHLRINADALDQAVESVLLGYLADPRRAKRLLARDGQDAELARVRAELAAARESWQALKAAYAAGRVTDSGYFDVEPSRAKRVAELEQVERQLMTPGELVGLFDPGQQVAAVWQDMPMPARRAAARILLSPAYLGTVRIRREPVFGWQAPAQDRIDWVRNL